MLFPVLCVKEENNFFKILREFTSKFDILFHFGICDQDVIGINGAQAREMTVLQEYCNMESFNTSVIIRNFCSCQGIAVKQI